ncbi:peptidoglycan-binding domain-containing protein [Rhodosalinus sp. 5P4]|uniref:peptidoglycan-binding domain-containing protein n=1 Tax=Rhodosalinus sp. 5P4 TaxID=3239196 RepID=UPI003525324A
MKTPARLALTLCAALAVLPTLSAADRALVIGAMPEERQGLFGTSSGPDVAAALRAAGFETVAVPGDDLSEARSALSDLLAVADGEERIVIYLSGAFLRDDGRSWMTEAGAEGPLDLVTVEGAALSVETVLAVAGRAPGGAVVALALAGNGPDPGAGLRRGATPGAVPQGVTVLQGPSASVARFVSEDLLVPGQRLATALAAARDVSATGFVTDRVPFLPEGQERAAIPAPDRDATERARWDAARERDDAAAYRDYLDRHPDGRFADAARAAIAEIEAEPDRAARLAEDALNLTRDERRQIQRHLTLLDHEPRGIDGIFGPGTRGAITRFQRDAGLPETGYLSARQIEMLDRQAERRQAELEAEAERRRLEQERRDRAAWEATGSGADEAGLRTYLQRFPDGLFADIATERLADIEAAKRDRAAERDRLAWEEARAAGTVAAYQAYLRAFPDGAFAAEAQARIAALQDDGSARQQQAREAEEALGLNILTRTLVERRLDQLGLEPGPADGVFDEATRRAIRRFQRARDLAVTGYLDEATVSRMLSDVGGLLERLR